jgi:hypothetical protein
MAYPAAAAAARLWFEIEVAMTVRLYLGKCKAHLCLVLRTAMVYI